MPTNSSPHTGLSNRMPLTRRPTPMVSPRPSYNKSTLDVNKLSLFLTTFQLCHCCHLISSPQVDPEPTPPPNSKQKPMPKLKTCRDNSTKMPKRPWMFFCRSAVRLAWRFLRQGSVLRKRSTANKFTLPINISIWENVGDRG